jgi:hypothetical protein
MNMGITLHFKGKLKNKEEINSLKDDLIDIAEIMQWEWDSLDEDWTKPTTAKLEINELQTEIIGHLPLKGIELKLHPHCESLTLYFDKEGNLSTPFSLIMMNEGKLNPEESYISVKTQFAPPDIHISIVKLLEFLKNRYIPDLEVIDEGGYWNSRDKTLLIEKISFLTDKMDIVEGMLLSLDREEFQQYSTNELARLIEEKLKKGLNKN